MRIVMLDEPRPGVEILLDGQVARVLEASRAVDGSLTIEYEYANGERGGVVLPPDDEPSEEDKCEPS